MNPGKIFEGEIRDSISDEILYYRIKDPAQGFGGSGTRFSLHNPCDAIIYKYPHIYFLELKSTKGTSISFSTEENNKMIKKCQIDGLTEFSKYEGSICGFLLNFRNSNHTYWLEINCFLKFLSESTKKSINEKDVIEYCGLVIPQTKKRTRYTYDISKILKGDE